MILRHLFAASAVVALVACGTQPPKLGDNPLGGKMNTGGTPDPNKTNTGGTPDTSKTNADNVGTGGKVNTGGAPDPGKTNTGGAPDLSKSAPPGSKKDGGK